MIFLPHIENYASFQNKDGFRNKVINFKQVFSAQRKLRISTSNEDDEIKLTEEDRNAILCQRGGDDDLILFWLFL